MSEFPIGTERKVVGGIERKKKRFRPAGVLSSWWANVLGAIYWTFCSSPLSWRTWNCMRSKIHHTTPKWRESGKLDRNIRCVLRNAPDFSLYGSSISVSLCIILWANRHSWCHTRWKGYRHRNIIRKLFYWIIKLKIVVEFVICHRSTIMYWYYFDGSSFILGEWIIVKFKSSVKYVITNWNQYCLLHIVNYWNMYLYRQIPGIIE